MSRPTLPSAAYAIVPKIGDADCTIACLAMAFRREYGEILVAAARVSKTVWKSGLSCPEMIRVARALKIRAVFTEKFDPEEDTGVLWVSFRDRSTEHAVVLVEGWIFDPEHTPVSMWEYDQYCAVQNAVPKTLLKEIVK